MLSDLEKQLISYWAKTLKCRECSLPKRYRPQLRPVGIDYKVGGVLFLQINPGEIGSLTKSKIKQRYRTTTERKIACYKNQGTKKLLALQDVFAHRPIVGNWRKLAKAYNEFWMTSGLPSGLTTSFKISTVRAITAMSCSNESGTVPLGLVPDS